MRDGPMSDQERQQNSKTDDDLVFDELGNIYLLEDVLMQLLLNFKRNNPTFDNEDNQEMQQ